jgi:hypothetical protein
MKNQMKTGSKPVSKMYGCPNKLPKAKRNKGQLGDEEPCGIVLPQKNISLRIRAIASSKYMG